MIPINLCIPFAISSGQGVEWGAEAEREEDEECEDDVVPEDALVEKWKIAMVPVWPRWF